MIVTEIYKGQGLGNQLWCYVVTRVIAKDRGYTFGIKSPEKFKCLDFMNLDFGEKVIGGSGPEGGSPHTLPDGITHYYNERKLVYMDGTDIRTYDENLLNVPDNTKIDGIMQDEQYIIHRKNEIREWLKIKEGYEVPEYSNENTCIINFRGGEYVGLQEVFLTKKYWNDAIKHMRGINPSMKFVVVTDDVKTAKKFFPHFECSHRSIGHDYSIINNAYYLILSNSSFAFFPAWLNTRIKKIIAPKYWARHNVSDGYWACDYNLTSQWMYLDRDGILHNYDSCKKELDQYKNIHSDLYKKVKIEDTFLVVSNYYNDLSWVPEYTDNYIVYDQSDVAIYPPKLHLDKIIKSPHLGHNIRDYCTYIIDHYENLPERVAFVTGNIFPRHVARDCFDKLVNNTFFTPFIDHRKHHTRWPISFISKDGLYNEINDSWYLHHHPTKYFHNYNDFLQFCFKKSELPKYVKFTPGANYIVPKENILKLPKIFYENLRVFVSHSPTVIPGESHIIERALYTLWSSNFEINENMLSPIGENFSAKPRIKTAFVYRAVMVLIHTFWNTVNVGNKVINKISQKLSV